MKKLRPIFLFSLLIISLVGQSQVLFENHYNVYYSQRFIDLICKSDGNFITGGLCFPSPGQRRPWITEIDSLGNMVWEKTFNNNHRYNIFSITLLEESGYLLCGIQKPLDIFDPDTFYIYKTNFIGDSIWSRFYFRGAAYDAIELANDTAIVVGINYEKACAVKLNPNGDIIGIQDYFEQNWPYSIIHSISRLSDTLFLLTGAIGDANNYFTYYVFIDDHLNKKWSTVFNNFPGFSGIKSLVNENQIITLSQTWEGTGLHLLINSDTLGNLIWAREIDLGDSCGATSFIKYDDESYYTCGGKYARGAFLSKIDSSGNKLWQKFYGSQVPSEFSSISTSTDNLIVMAGMDNHFAYLVKSDTSGIFVKMNEMPFTDQAISYYPNPFLDNLIIESKTNNIDQIILTDPLGKILFKSEGYNFYNVQLSYTHHGLVFIKVIFSNGNQQTFKVIKL